jgi:hypothetical protein
MRRRDREITDIEEIKRIIKQALFCHVAMCRGSNPYLVAMNFGFDEQYIYLHSAPEGMKIDILRENPAVCIEIVQNIQFVHSLNVCQSSMRYNSALIFGKVEFIQEEKEKKKALNFIIRQYNQNIGEERLKFSENVLDKVTVLKVKIEKISGKRSA